MARRREETPALPSCSTSNRRAKVQLARTKRHRLLQADAAAEGKARRYAAEFDGWAEGGFASLCTVACTPVALFVATCDSIRLPM